jgi:hypothetical protein
VEGVYEEEGVALVGVAQLGARLKEVVQAAVRDALELIGAQLVDKARGEAREHLGDLLDVPGRAVARRHVEQLA